METQIEQPIIVVGVNATPESLAALDWAITWAQACDARLRVITAYNPANPGSDAAGSYLNAMTKHEASARARTAQAIMPRLRSSRLRYDHIVALGEIDTVLDTLSRDAMLAVVGSSKPTGWFARFRRSTAQRLVGRLGCPLVSVTVDQGVPGASAKSVDTAKASRVLATASR